MDMTDTHPVPLAPISWGELLDKITILEIKTARVADAAKRANIRKELTLLAVLAAPVLAEVAPLLASLKAINEQLWDIEERIRDKEAAQAFDADFIVLARSIYRLNDERAAVKKQINLQLDSELVEEKSYRPA
jgi:hypothetical protein